MNKAIGKSFIEIYTPTIGFEFSTFSIRINKSSVKLKIWDTSGDKNYKSLISGFSKNSSLAILFYSIDNKESFNNIENFLNDFRKDNPNGKIILVGNKSDLEESRKVSKDEGEKFAQEHKLDMFFETSAKSGYNAQMTLIEAEKLLYREYIENKVKEEKRKIEEENKKEEEEKENEEEEENEEESDEKEEEEKDLQIKEYKNKKCSLNEHKENDSFCPECNIYMCTKCEKMHSGLFQNHHQYDLNNTNEIFIGLCKEKNHSLKLDYYFKDHNQLCCFASIAKIKYKGNGKHKDCKVCSLKKIKNKKKEKLEENIKNLENLSNKIEQTIKELKIMLEKIDKNKEELKTKIKETFAKMRNEINKREDELLLETDKLFEEMFLDEKTVKKNEKLTHEIKIYLERGKKVNEYWNNKEKLSQNINDCINIENTIEKISNINDKIEFFKNKKNFEVKLKYNEEQFENYLKEMKKFGEICYDEENLQGSKEEDIYIEKEEEKDKKENKDEEEKKDKEEKDN